MNTVDDSPTEASAEPSPWRPADAMPWCEPPHPDDDKYTRGVLGLRTGSATYPGAAVLGAEAAYRTGIGSLRFVPALEDEPARHGLPTPAALVLRQRPETVIIADSAAARGSVSAWVLGSGTERVRRSLAERTALTEILAAKTPVVLDAGALPLIAERTDAQPGAPVVATPHRGEFIALWRQVGLGDRPPEWPTHVHGAARGIVDVPREAPPLPALIDACVTLAAHLRVTILLKGSRTVIATPSGVVRTVGPATPWLATAGTGDVLAGALGALLARHSRAVRGEPELLGELAASAALLHDAAARVASGDPPPEYVGADRRAVVDRTVGGPITALDVAHALPRVLASWRMHPPYEP